MKDSATQPQSNFLRLTVPNESGQHVKEIQEHLNAHGFKVEVDSQFGISTQKALKNFQRKMGIKPTGILDPGTEFRLRGGIRLGRNL